MTDPAKDAERLVAKQWIESRPHGYALSASDLATYSARQTASRDAIIARLTQERDEAKHRAEALEAEVGRLQEAIARERVENERLRALAGEPTAQPYATPPAADHTERAREIVDNLRTWVASYRAGEQLFTADSAFAERACTEIAAALTAAERAGTEKMRALDEAAIKASCEVNRCAALFWEGRGVPAEFELATNELHIALAARDTALTEGKADTKKPARIDPGRLG